MEPIKVEVDYDEAYEASRLCSVPDELDTAIDQALDYLNEHEGGSAVTIILTIKG
jgi:hypothetical protein